MINIESPDVILNFKRPIPEEHYEHYLELLKEATSSRVVRSFTSHKDLKDFWFMLQVVCAQAQTREQFKRTYTHLKHVLKVGTKIGQVTLTFYF
ncbi:MAG TPA: hypothetical protein VMT20_15410 [Terriglobia bacterium]|nr:hypothetical protein [Terriglobia bacterium]